MTQRELMALRKAIIACKRNGMSNKEIIPFLEITSLTFYYQLGFIEDTGLDMLPLREVLN